MIKDQSRRFRTFPIVAKEISGLELNSIVCKYLESQLGNDTYDTINFHLRKIVGSDLSEIMVKPNLVGTGLRKIFGMGDKFIVRAAIFAAFRANGQVPDSEYESLEAGFKALQIQTRPQNPDFP